MRISIKKLFVIALMSALTNVVVAQTTSTTKNDVAKIEQSDSVKIARAITKIRINEDDADMVKTLLRHHNKPLEGGIAEDDVIINGSKYGDDWKSYISYQSGTFYLTYIVTREQKFVGRLDIRLN